MPAAPAAIIHATLDLLADGGLDELTMQRVAARAKVSVGTLYNYVADKDELVAAAHAEFLERVNALDRAELGSAVRAPEEVIELAVRQHITVARAHGALVRAFAVQAIRDPAIRASGAAQIRTLSRAFAADLAAVRPSMTVEHADVAITVCFRLVHDTTVRTLTHGPRFAVDEELGWDDLADELTAACIAYLLGEDG